MAKEVEKTRGNAAAVPDEVADGLEDVGAGDVLLPIIKIDHKEGHFVDSLTNETFDEFQAVMLGLVKGRILWPSQLGEEGQQPLCRSLNFTEGRPSDEFVQRDVSKQYPSKVSKFTKSVVEVAIGEAAKGPGADPDLLLSCGDCGLKEWDTMPSNSTPWCSEQFTFPILRITESGGFAPAYITFQRASLKACKAYISAFRQSNRPMYTVVTTIRAIHQKRGTVEFVTPEFTKGEQTDPSMWKEFSENLHDIREFLTTPRVRDDSGDEEEEEEETTPKPSRGKKADVIETTATDADDDEPEEDEPEEESEEDEVDDEPDEEPDDDDDDDDDEEPF